METPCLPTYVLSALIPMEVCAHVASFMLHPKTTLRRYADMQCQYVSGRIGRAMALLQKEYDRHETMIYMSAWYALGRIQRILRRRMLMRAILASKPTVPRHHAEAYVHTLVARSTWPVYMMELKTWMEHGWHKSFLKTPAF